MVSGFFTSPWLHWRMSSPVARPMRSSSKKLTSSTEWTPFRGFVTALLDRWLGWKAPSRAPPRACEGRGGGGPFSHVFDGGRLAAGQVDAQLLRGPEDLVVGVTQFDRLPVAGEDLHVQAERLQLLEQHLERLRNARLGDVLALDDRLVHLDAAEDVVGLDGEQLLQGVGRAVGLHRPAFHLTEALPTELRLTT